MPKVLHEQQFGADEILFPENREPEFVVPTLSVELLISMIAAIKMSLTMFLKTNQTLNVSKSKLNQRKNSSE